jgi:transcriptional regulator with XRE-family HTH domain
VQASLGQRIRELRQAKDLSLREFAKRLGDLTPPYLSDIELGRRYPSASVLEKMAKALDVPVNELRALDPRPPIDDLKKLGVEDPKLGFALRQVVDRKVSGQRLIELLKEVDSERPKKK